jgi:hypothetical protein
MTATLADPREVQLFDTFASHFTWEDEPMGFEAGDANLYRYVGNSPTNFGDPRGLQPPPIWVAPYIHTSPPPRPGPGKGKAAPCPTAAPHRPPRLYGWQDDNRGLGNANPVEEGIIWYFGIGRFISIGQWAFGGDGSANQGLPGTETNRQFGDRVGWGKGPDQAAARTASITCEDIANANITRAEAESWRTFYQSAIDSGRGGQTAVERLKLMEKILRIAN